MTATVGMQSLQVTIFGPAATQGSKTAIRNKQGRVVGSRESSKRIGPWRQDLRELMIRQRPVGFSIWDEAVTLEIRLWVNRPKGHFGTGKNGNMLKPSAPVYPGAGLDIDKVSRAIFDAGQGIWWSNDSRISDLTVQRRYCENGDAERTEITATLT